MKYVIIGASGIIGYNLYNYLKSLNLSVIGTYCNHKKEGLIHYDIRDDITGIEQDDVVFLLSNKIGDDYINITRTKQVINQLHDIGCRILYPSSTEVFDGEKGNYSESDKPNPVSTFGKMKYEIQQHIESICQNYCIFRPSWVIDYNTLSKCVIRYTYEELLKSDAKMAIDNTFTIVDVNDVSNVLFKISLDKSIQLCHIASQLKLFRYELADKIISHSEFGHKMGYKKVLFKDIPYKEKRPRLNDLDTSFAIKTLGIKFKDADNIIKEKVHILDRFTSNNLK